MTKKFIEWKQILFYKNEYEKKAKLFIIYLYRQFDDDETQKKKREDKKEKKKTFTKKIDRQFKVNYCCVKVVDGVLMKKIWPIKNLFCCKE